MTKALAFRISYYCLGLALLTMVGLPVGCAITMRDNSGWDYLSDDINFLSWSTALIVGFLLVSLATGVYALKEFRVATLWVLPLGLCLIIGVGSSIFGLYIYIFDPYGI